MRVSVVLCTYPGQDYDEFVEAAESVLVQTYPDVELVVVIDGAPALYDRVMTDYGDSDGVTLLLNEENRGLLESRNRGAEAAGGDVVAFIDDDAVADEAWIERLVTAYEDHDALAAGGKMVPEWVAGKPSFLPEEFYWLVGVTHKGFASGPGEVRNTFGSNISFRRDVFLELGGFDTDIGGRKGDQNLQGGETELCARLRAAYDRGVYYVPDAEVAHKVYDYRTDVRWLLDRAFWQGYSKRAMDQLLPEADAGTAEESAFLRQLLLGFLPGRLADLVRRPSMAAATQFVMLVVLTGTVGLGYGYAILKGW